MRQSLIEHKNKCYYGANVKLLKIVKQMLQSDLKWKQIMYIEKWFNFNDHK